jgi:hypothetical protein
MRSLRTLVSVLGSLLAMVACTADQPSPMSPDPSPRFSTVGNFAAPISWDPAHVYQFSFVCHHAASNSRAETFTNLSHETYACGDVLNLGPGLGITFSYTIYVFDENNNLVTSCNATSELVPSIKCGGGKYTASLLIKDLG